MFGVFLLQVRYFVVVGCWWRFGCQHCFVCCHDGCGDFVDFLYCVQGCGSGFFV